MNSPSQDPFHLARFVEAQSSSYADALRELEAGEKRGHWMWFIFPQVAGLGSSFMAKRYAIGSRQEAAAYLDHPLLGARLLACVDALLNVENRSAKQIMGSPDFMKLQSSITLFAEISPDEERFRQLLLKFYAGKKDERTLQFLSR